MSFVYRMKLLTFIVCLLSVATAIAGDAASDPPTTLAAGQLRAIQEVSLDDLDAQARDSVQLARRQLNEVLQTQPVMIDKLAAAYGELGGLYQIHAAFPAAGDCYHNAVQLAPGEFRWAYYAAYLAEKNGRIRLALERYRQAQKLNSAYKAVAVRLGNILLELDELEQAKAAYEQVVNETGLEAASLYGLGQIALLQRDYDTAIDAFTRALEYDPAASRIHYPLAQALRATQRNEEAKAQLALRGDQPPSFRDPLIENLEAQKTGSRYHFLQAMKATKQQDYKAASEAFAEGLSGEPDNALARISYARTLYLIGDKTAARQALEAALAIQPDNSLALFLLGVLTEEQGDAEKAADYYRLAIQHSPEHTGAHQFLADQYYRQGNYTAAAEHYASSIQGEPSNLAATIPYIGTLLLSDAPGPTLMAGLDTAIKRFPEYPGFRSLQILLLAGSRNPEIQDPEMALKYAQQLNEQYRIPPHQELLALACAASGDYPQAIAIQEELLSYARRAMPLETERVAGTLAYYQDETLPPLDELINYSALQPQGFDATTVFRDYPAARPY
jgi:tetratricopeptide (TPR) repeat protein